MTRLLLIRHGDTDVAGRVLTGRSPGVHLNERGRRQAAELDRRLVAVAIDAVWASPLERARETATPVADARGLAVETVAELQEVAQGDWQGRSVQDLAPVNAWQHYNAFRSLYGIPGGESLAEVQLRMLRVLQRAWAEFPDGCVAAVSHGDPIRGLLVHLLGMPLDLAARLEVSPASVSIVHWAGEAPLVVCSNCTGDCPL